MAVWLKFYLFLGFFCDFNLGDVGNKWGYKDGLLPHQWPNAYPECGGLRQSPINIDSSTAVLNSNLQPFVLTDIENIRFSVMTIVNHGKTVEIDLLGDHYIHGGSLPGRYKVKQFHFHWGLADYRGSEHDFNGKQYPMEMHIVTYSSKFADFHDAANATAGLAVLSFLIDIGQAENNVFEDVCHYFANIVREDENVTVENFPMMRMLPTDLGVYYRYYGSLTTPSCHESVLWTVFRYPVVISKSQIDAFRVLGNRYINQQQDIRDNFRPLQALNGRNVYTNDRRGIFPNRPGGTVRQQNIQVPQAVSPARRRTFRPQNNRQLVVQQHPTNQNSQTRAIANRNIQIARLQRQNNLNTNRRTAVRPNQQTNIRNQRVITPRTNNNARLRFSQRTNSQNISPRRRPSAEAILEATRRLTARTRTGTISPNRLRNIQNFNRYILRLAQQIENEASGINSNTVPTRTRQFPTQMAPQNVRIGNRIFRLVPANGNNQQNIRRSRDLSRLRRARN